MRFVYLGNNRAGYELLLWLIDSGSPPSGIAIHPTPRAKYREEMLALAQAADIGVLDADRLNTADGRSWVANQRPDLLVSVYFGYLLKPDLLSVPAGGAINLHPSLLPYSRGAHSNVWNIVEHTPAGVTIHYIDDSIDGGDVVAQREVHVCAADTGESLHCRLEEAAIELFKDTWPLLCSGCVKRTPQTGTGTFHRIADLQGLDRIQPNDLWRARDLIDLLRARSFPPYQGAYLDLGDRRIYLRLELIEVSTDEPPYADAESGS